MPAGGISSHFTSEELGKVALFSLVPASAAVVGNYVFVTEKSMANWNKAKKPSWCPQDPKTFAVIDALVTAPLGCASYLVFKHGGGFKDSETSTALAAYGASLGFGYLLIPYLFGSRPLKEIAAASVITSVSSGFANYLFYKIYPSAGLMMLPFSVACAYYAAVMLSVSKQEGGGAESAKK